MAMRLRHAVRLAREVGFYAIDNKAWWLLPVAISVAAGVLIVTATHAAVPYAVYTLF
jgi:hypothetical protein